MNPYILLAAYHKPWWSIIVLWYRVWGSKIIIMTSNEIHRSGVKIAKYGITHTHKWTEEAISLDLPLLCISCAHTHPQNKQTMKPSNLN